jgi:hypothetical protein
MAIPMSRIRTMPVAPGRRSSIQRQRRHSTTSRSEADPTPDPLPRLPSGHVPTTTAHSWAALTMFPASVSAAACLSAPAATMGDLRGECLFPWISTKFRLRALTGRAGRQPTKSRFRATTRRRNRTFQAGGCPALLKSDPSCVEVPISQGFLQILLVSAGQNRRVRDTVGDTLEERSVIGLAGERHVPVPDWSNRESGECDA